MPDDKTSDTIVPFTKNTKPISITNGEFIRAVFGKDDWRCHVAAFAEDPTQLDVLGLRHYWGGKIWDHWSPKPVDDWNTFFTISVFEADPADGRHRRRKVAHDRTYCIVIDDVNALNVPWEDTSAKVAMDQIKLSPTWSLETSPNNYQFGYIIDGGDPRGGKVDAALNAMVDAGLVADGSDPGMKGVTRYVRLPVGTNTKRKYGSTGFRHVLRSWHPERKFTLEDIADAYDIRADVDAADDELGASGAPAVDPNEDWILDVLSSQGKILSHDQTKKLWHVECPFVHDHTARANSGTAYLGAGMWTCHHGHCIDRNHDDFTNELRRQFPKETETAVHDVAVKQFDDGKVTTGDAGVPERTKISEEVEEIREIFGDAAAEDHREKRELGPFQQHMSRGKTTKEIIAEGVARQGMWQLHDTVPQTGVGFIYGDTGTAKSFLVLDLLNRMSTGMEWQGLRFLEPGLCLYVSSEGGSIGTQNRTVAWGMYHGSTGSDDMYVLPENFRFGPGEEAMAQANKLILWLNRWAKQSGKPVRMVALDTMSANMIGDENNAEDVRELLNLCKHIARRTGAFVWLVHHTGKDGTRGLRGSSTMDRDTDVVIRVERDKMAGIHAPGSILIEKVKDGAVGQVFGFSLEIVDLGLDTYGNQITSLVVIETAAPKKKVSIGSMEQYVVDAVEDLSGFTDTKGVLVDQVLTRATELGKIGGVNDSTMRRYKKPLDNLIRKGVLVIDKDADRVWLI